MPKVAICPHCLSSAIVPLAESGSWKAWVIADSDHLMTCFECCAIFGKEDALQIEQYPDDACFSLTDAGRAAIQEMPHD